MELVTTWYGAFLVDEGRIVRELRFPEAPAELAGRMRMRRDGHLAPEEERLIEEGTGAEIESRDRRLESMGVRGPEGPPVPLAAAPPPGVSLRDLLIAEAEEALRRAWDPSIHLDEAVRTMADVDRVRNLLGERLASWSARDRPELGEDEEEAAVRAARTLVDGTAPGAGTDLDADPRLLESRRELARAFEHLAELRRSLDRSVDAAARERVPNLSALLGPLLAARLVSQAGGLDRLARLPASTVQVLGAERSFFEHLRRGTRPPRHGLLYLHPSIQGAPKRQRGRLARALAGKAAIAARLDRAGRPLRPELIASYSRRSEEIRRPPSGKAGRILRPPLDGAPEDR